MIEYWHNGRLIDSMTRTEFAQWLSQCFDTNVYLDHGFSRMSSIELANYANSNFTYPQLAREYFIATF